MRSLVVALLFLAGCPNGMVIGDDFGPRPDATIAKDAAEPTDATEIVDGDSPMDASVEDAEPEDAAPEDAAPEDAGSDAGSCPLPEPVCVGVCALMPPSCTANGWECTGPGYEAIEASCDGYDNDCDGMTDEDVCPICAVPTAVIDANLYSIWDVDFDYACRTYLTSYISGPDYARAISATVSDPVATYFGNANQDMGFGLVDPNPANQRVVVSYSCCEACNCQATNGITLLYTCSAIDPSCGCAGQINCPGFLDEPFLPTGTLDTSVSNNGFVVSVPNGLAVGPGDRFYAGNFQPETCSTSTTCDACDPNNPGIFCSTARPNCCDTSPFGRLAEFTLPSAGVDPTWRIVQILPGEEIMGLASGRDGSVYVGTYAGPNNGNLYRYDPFADTLLLLRNFPGTVFSITEDRQSGELYLEIMGSPKLHHLTTTGSTLALPAGVPSDPAAQGVLQYGPDHRLYRLIGRVDANSTLDSYPLP